MASVLEPFSFGLGYNNINKERHITSRFYIRIAWIRNILFLFVFYYVAFLLRKPIIRLIIGEEGLSKV